jgi:hypothetical protein
MKGILADTNIERHVRVLLTFLEGDDWLELWESLGLVLHSFDSLNLPRTTKDRELWAFCQQQGIVLITANRNSDGSDSLDAAIRELNTPQDLPVFTLAKSDDVLASKAYAERTAVRLLDYLMRIDTLRGTGRLYIP